jgi:hypothetical protein
MEWGDNVSDTFHDSSGNIEHVIVVSMKGNARTVIFPSPSPASGPQTSCQIQSPFGILRLRLITPPTLGKGVLIVPQCCAFRGVFGEELIGISLHLGYG